MFLIFDTKLCSKGNTGSAPVARRFQANRQRALIGNAPARAALSSKLPVLLVTYFFDFLPSNGDFP